MRKLLFVAVGIGIVGYVAFQTQATSQDPPNPRPPGHALLIQQVDVDGDGENTAGDRAVVNWWLDHGGNFGDLAAAAGPENGGVRNVRDFLRSPAAQLGGAPSMPSGQ